MRRLFSCVILFLMLCLLGACSGGDNSAQIQSQQSQISTLQTKLAAVQTQLSSAQAQGVDSAAISTVITSLTQTQSNLSQLVSTGSAKTSTSLTTAGNQALVLQSLADSLTVTSQSVISAYTTAQTSLTSLTTQFNTATAQVAALTTQLATSQSSNSDLTSQLAAANAQVTTLTGQITTLNSTVTSLQTQLSSANATIAAGNSQITSLTGQVATLTSSNGSLTSQLATANAQISTLNGQITTLNAQIASLTDSNNTLTTNNTSLTSQLATANASILTLQGQVTSLQAQLDSASVSNTSLTAQLATATGTIATLNAQVTLLTSELDTATTTTTTQAATIAALNSTITSLNATIASMVAIPVVMSVDLTNHVSVYTLVTATFPSSQNGKTATFTATGGNLLTSPKTVTIANGTASARFGSDSTGTFNIYVVDGLYAGGAIVDVTATPAATYNIYGTISLNGTGLPNVIVTLTGDKTGATTTAFDGTYALNGVPNGSYTITPSLSGFSFASSSLSVTVSGATVNGNNFTAYLPAAEEVKLVYDQVNNDVNYLCSSDVNTGATATYSYASGTLAVSVTATSGTVFPLYVAYTLTNFVSGSYTVSGTMLATVTAPDHWTSYGTLTAIGGDINTIIALMARTGDPNVMTGTLTVNGYPYDYATGAYK